MGLRPKTQMEWLKFWDILSPERQVEALATQIMDYQILTEHLDVALGQSKEYARPTLVLYGNRYIRRSFGGEKESKSWNPLLSWDDAMMLIEKMKEYGFKYSLTNEGSSVEFSLFKEDEPRVLYSYTHGADILENIALTCWFARFEIQG